MEWQRCKPPSQIHDCECDSSVVEKRSDGLVREYRCGGCRASLGDVTIGHEP